VGQLPKDFAHYSTVQGYFYTWSRGRRATGRDGLSAHCYLNDNPRLVLVVPRPLATCTGEHLKPMNRLVIALSTMSILSLTGMRTIGHADQDIIRKVTAEHRLRLSESLVDLQFISQASTPTADALHV
jgi:hypothetical protein